MDSISPDQCRFCPSRRCFTRICTRDGRFDEVACSRHVRELERLADGTLGVNNGVLRLHLQGTAPYRRGEELK